MKDQVDRLATLRIPAVSLNEDAKDVERGRFPIIYNGEYYHLASVPCVKFK